MCITCTAAGELEKIYLAPYNKKSKSVELSVFDLDEVYKRKEGKCNIEIQRLEKALKECLDKNAKLEEKLKKIDT
jgi:hypothetical protein